MASFGAGWKMEGNVEISYVDDVSGMLHVYMMGRKCDNGELVDDVRQKMYRPK